MAQFSISLINKHGTTVLTDYDTLAGKTAGLTFDERLNLNIDGSTLDFSMLKYLYEGSHKVVNTPTVSITYGSIIKCLHNGHRYDFAVTDINYQFLAENLQLNFSAQDYFQFETSKLGIGYSVSGDTTDPSYFGAQPIDAWAYKIIQDNNLRWGYIPINQANQDWINTALTAQQRNDTFVTDDNGLNYWDRIWDDSTMNQKVEYTLNQWVSFECSESSAYNALKQLAADNGLMIMVDYAAHNFWFVPKHNIIFHGYYFNPNNNLQQFSVRGSAQNLITVLNVTGPKDVNNHEITLVPHLPTQVVNWIASSDWDRSIYYSGLYTPHTSDITFLRESAYTPWLENKLIDISFFQDNHLLLDAEVAQIQNILYNKLRRINGHLLVEQNTYLTQYGKDFTNFNQKIIDGEGISASLYGDIDTITELIESESNTPACFAVVDRDGTPWVYWPQNYTLCGNFGPVTAQSIINGQYNGFLYCPEIDSTVQVQRYAIPDASASWTTPIYIRDNNALDMAWYLCQVSGDTLRYQGSIIEIGQQYCWCLSTEDSCVAHNQAQLTIPDWCSTLLCYMQGRGETHPFQLTRTQDGITFSYYTGTQWTTPQLLTAVSQSFTWIRCSIVDNILSYSCNVAVTSIKVGVSVFNTSALLSWSFNGTTIATFAPYCTNGQLYIAATNNSANTVYIPISNSTHSIGPNTSQNITLPVTTNTYTNISVYFQEATVDNSVIRHVAIQKGPLTLYAVDSLQDINNAIRTNDLVVNFAEEHLSSPLFFTALNTAEGFTKDTLSKKEVYNTIVSEQLNTLCSLRDSYAQTLAQNCWELLDLWDFSVYGNLNLGTAALQFQDVAVIEGEDEIIPGSLYNNVDSTIFTESECTFLRKALDIADEDTLYRLAVIQYVARLHASITEKWDSCYAAAMGLGIYWPVNWNNSHWLVEHPYLARAQVDLLQYISPLQPSNWNQPNYTFLNLIPNFRLMPVSKNQQTVTKTMSAAPQSATWDIYTATTNATLYLSVELLVSIHESRPTAVTDIEQRIIESFTLIAGYNHSVVRTYQIGTQNVTISARFEYHTSNILSLTLTVPVGCTTVITTIDNIPEHALKPVKTIYTSYQFRDKAEVDYNGLQAVTDNTQLKPQLLPQDIAQNNNNSYYWAYARSIDPSRLQLYQTQHNLLVERASPDIGGAVVPAQILALPFPHSSNYNSHNYVANPNLYNLYLLSQQTLYNTEPYYKYLQEHNDCWKDLLQDYPGIFRESTYNNTTATNSQELYTAAKAQLDNLSRPSFEYTLSGMDIYMYNSDFIPTRLKLGEQIRIDYQDPDQLTDTLNAALREPLYLTGINHTLRNDGDYQFTVTTRTATDTMVQRFAQLLAFGR